MIGLPATLISSFNINESGKGDHRHFRGEEKPYKFIDVETLVADFLADVEQVRKD